MPPGCDSHVSWNTRSSVTEKERREEEQREEGKRGGGAMKTRGQDKGEEDVLVI
jgi:hypothetical protein